MRPITVQEGRKKEAWYSGEAARVNSVQFEVVPEDDFVAQFNEPEEADHPGVVAETAPVGGGFRGKGIWCR